MDPMFQFFVLLDLAVICWVLTRIEENTRRG